MSMWDKKIKQLHGSRQSFKGLIFSFKTSVSTQMLRPADEEKTRKLNVAYKTLREIENKMSEVKELIKSLESL